MAPGERSGSVKIFLVRHGESEANFNANRYLSQEGYPHDVALTGKGRAQAAACGERLCRLVGTRNYTVFHSPYVRAQQTWEGIETAMARPPARVVVDGRLREQEYKDVTSKEELEYKKARARLRGKLYYRYSGGESGYDVVNRVGGFYNQLRFDLKAGNVEERVIVVCHEVVMRCFLLVALGYRPEQYDTLAFRNCQVVTLAADERLAFRRKGRA